MFSFFQFSQTLINHFLNDLMNFFCHVVETTRNRFFRSAKPDDTTNNDTDQSRLAGRSLAAAEMVTPSPSAMARVPQPPTALRPRNMRFLRQLRNGDPMPTRPLVAAADAPMMSGGSRTYYPFQTQIARNLIDFTRGYPNTRSHHRRQLQAKTRLHMSAADPQNYPNSFADERIRPHHFDTIMCRPAADLAEVRAHAWNSQDRSLNVFVKEDHTTMHRYPVPKSTDGIRGKVGYSRGFHVWEINWPEKQRGTHPVLGVSTKSTPLHSAGYGSLLGQDAHSYGWDLNVLRCYHDAKNTKSWAYPANAPPFFFVPTTIYCILDMEEGYMAFATPTQYLGVAFRGLAGQTLYPTVSAVWGQCEVGMRYIGGLAPTPRLLVDICRKRVRSQMGESRLQRVGELELPATLERYVAGRS